MIDHRFDGATLKAVYEFTFVLLAKSYTKFVAVGRTHLSKRQLLEVTGWAMQEEPKIVAYRGLWAIPVLNRKTLIFLSVHDVRKLFTYFLERKQMFNNMRIRIRHITTFAVARSGKTHISIVISTSQPTRNLKYYNNKRCSGA